MSKDIEETITEAEEMLGTLDQMAREKLNDAEQKIKKGIVQGVIWILVTVVIYFIWGTTWFFWVSFVLSIMMAISMALLKVVLAKAKRTITEDDDKDEEKKEYDEKQKVLETLLNELGEIAEEHGEIYDTECREQMSAAVFNGFIFAKKGYTLPNTFGLYEKDGNDAVKKSLDKYITEMLILAKESSEKERLEMFQDAVYNQDDESPDEFFGWVDEDDFEYLR